MCALCFRAPCDCVPALQTAAEAQVMRLPTRVRTITNEVPEVVAMLEQLLERARKGDLRAIACAAVYSDGLTADAGSNTSWALDKHTNFALGDGIRQLGHDWGEYVRARRNA